VRLNLPFRFSGGSQPVIPRPLMSLAMRVPDIGFAFRLERIDQRREGDLCALSARLF